MAASASPIDVHAHWEHVYQTKADQDTSWFQTEPVPSIDLVMAHAPRGGRIIDIGGGQSSLAGRLVAEGFKVAVLDISTTAIDRAKKRISESAQRVRWIVGDVTQVQTLGEFDLWHDRAVFHFLTDGDHRKKYVAQAERSIVPGGHMIIGTFALDGPEKCSGLPVQRYDEVRLKEVFGTTFELIRSLHQPHLTPWGKPQAFFFAVLRKR